MVVKRTKKIKRGGEKPELNQELIEKIEKIVEYSNKINNIQSITANNNKQNDITDYNRKLENLAADEKDRLLLYDEKFIYYYLIYKYKETPILKNVIDEFIEDVRNKAKGNDINNTEFIEIVDNIDKVDKNTNKAKTIATERADVTETTQETQETQETQTKQPKRTKNVSFADEPRSQTNNARNAENQQTHADVETSKLKPNWNPNDEAYCRGISNDYLCEEYRRYKFMNLYDTTPHDFINQLNSERIKELENYLSTYKQDLISWTSWINNINTAISKNITDINNFIRNIKRKKLYSFGLSQKYTKTTMNGITQASQYLKYLIYIYYDLLHIVLIPDSRHKYGERYKQIGGKTKKYIFFPTNCSLIPISLEDMNSYYNNIQQAESATNLISIILNFNCSDIKIHNNDIQTTIMYQIKYNVVNKNKLSMICNYLFLYIHTVNRLFKLMTNNQVIIYKLPILQETYNSNIKEYSNKYMSSFHTIINNLKKENKKKEDIMKLFWFLEFSRNFDNGDDYYIRDYLYDTYISKRNHNVSNLVTSAFYDNISKFDSEFKNNALTYAHINHQNINRLYDLFFDI